MVSTLCAYPHDLLVMPSTYLANNEEAAPYAFGFAIPVSDAGAALHLPAVGDPQNAGSPMDYPLSSRLDETDAMVVFDDVLVPWERVFIHRDAEMCNGLYNRTGAMPQIMHQFSTKNLAKAEFMMALGFAIARSTKIDAHLHVQGMLAELIQYTEFVRACLRAERGRRRAERRGLMTPAAMPLWTVRMMFPKMFIRVCEIIQTLGAGGLVAVPSYAELTGPAAADVETYSQAANADSRDPDQAVPARLRRRGVVVLRPPAALRALLFGRSGPPRRRRSTTLYDKNTYVDRIARIARRSRRAAERSEEPDEVPAASRGGGVAPPR